MKTAALSAFRESLGLLIGEPTAPPCCVGCLNDVVSYLAHAGTFVTTGASPIAAP